MAITQKCLAELNRKIVDIVHRKAKELGSDVRAAGLGGNDGGLVEAREKFSGTRTGDVASVNARLLNVMAVDPVIPVIYPVCLGEDGGIMNVNADDVASAIAMEIGAKRLIFCSDTAVLDKEKRRINRLDPKRAQALIADGTIAGGMIPKVQACIEVVQSGKVDGVVILNGSDPESVATELLSDEGAGTLFRVPQSVAAAPVKNFG